jgi:precorrin-6B methylase 2
VQYDYEAVQVQVSQIKRVGRYDMLQADNPICIITATPKRPMEVA